MRRFSAFCVFAGCATAIAACSGGSGGGASTSGDSGTLGSATGTNGSSGVGTAGTSNSSNTGATGASNGAASSGATGASNGAASGETGLGNDGSNGLGSVAGGEAGAPRADDSGAECTPLANDAPPIHAMNLPPPMPEPTGGTIVDGVYDLTSYTLYDPSNQSTSAHQETLSITGQTMAIVKTGLTNSVDRAVWSFTLSGTSLTRTRTCPSSKTETVGYSATATTFSTYDGLSSAVRVYTRH